VIYLNYTKAVYKLMTTTLGLYATWLFGGWDIAIKVLVAFMIIDQLTGLIVAYINGELDSKIGFKGLLSKVLILIVLVVGVLLDRLIGSEWVFRTLVCYFFIANEGLSILENISKTGLPLPKQLKDKLAQLKEEGGNIDVK
jgi:toxin secretion/phage lysis holin